MGLFIETQPIGRIEPLEMRVARIHGPVLEPGGEGVLGGGHAHRLVLGRMTAGNHLGGRIIKLA